VHLRPAPASLIRFGNFELDSKSGELRRSGVLVKLPPQPAAVLRFLVENVGDLVTREQIQRRVWGDQTFVDFDRNLNVCMAQIRAALNDDADAPRFIRTVPKRGYMFLGPVERTGEPPQLQPAKHFGRNLALAILICAVAAAGYFTWRRTLPPDRVTLAVLPFESAPEDVPLGDGLVDELISHFGGIQGDRLGVIARSSVMRYRAHPDLSEVARTLGVQFAVEGTIRREQGRVRLTARLIRITDQTLAWTESFEDDASNLFRMEQESAARIAAGVTLALFPKTASPSFPHIVARDAYEAYRTGRAVQLHGDLERSLPHFEDAIRLDSRYVDAYAALADACVSLARSGRPPKPLLARAADAAAKALELDAGSAEAHNALANVRFWSDWNWSDAEKHFARALSINPSYAAAYHDYAWFLVAMGRTESGLSSLRHAIALDPLSVRVNIDAGWLLLQAHRYEQAIQQAGRAAELAPGLEEAAWCIQRAERLLGRGGAVPPTGSDLYSNAVHLATLGDKDAALDALEQAFEARALLMPLLKVDPAFTDIRSDSRFGELTRKVGL
jgi:DNA-binding winged helix-turn-helix (wHTH) protein/TolB-like protein